jgi:hypothetical protein
MISATGRSEVGSSTSTEVASSARVDRSSMKSRPLKLLSKNRLKAELCWGDSCLSRVNRYARAHLSDEALAKADASGARKKSQAKLGTIV